MKPKKKKRRRYIPPVSLNPTLILPRSALTGCPAEVVAVGDVGRSFDRDMRLALAAIILKAT